MTITTWQDAKQAGLTQDALQGLCNYDIALEERIKARLRIKHPTATDRQIDNWASSAIRRKMQQEHWGYSAY